MLTSYITLSYSEITQRFLIDKCENLLKGLSANSRKRTLESLKIKEINICSDNDFDLETVCSKIKNYLKSLFGELFYSTIDEYIDEYIKVIYLLNKTKEIFSFDDETCSNTVLKNIESFLNEQCSHLNYKVCISYSSLKKLWVISFIDIKDDFVTSSTSKKTVKEAALYFLTLYNENPLFKYIK